MSASRLLWVGLLVSIASAGTALAAGDTRLVDAARARDTRAARALVQKVPDVNAAGPNGATPLHWAAHWNDNELAALLLKAGADPNRVNDFGVSPLSLASSNGSAPMVKALLDARANPNASVTGGETVLMTAARTGNVESVRLLLAAGANPNAAESVRGQTALMWATAEGHLPVVSALLDKGADVQARTKPERGVAGVKSRGGSTALIFAARDGNIPISELLVSRGASVNDRPADDGSTPLLVATVRGQVDLAEWLLDHGADPNVAEAGYTPLHWTVGVWDSLLTHDYVLQGGEWGNIGGIPEEDQRLRLARALITHGADPNARVTRSIPRFGGSVTGAGEGMRGIEGGATPYLLAAMNGEAKLMRLLAAAGADTKFRGPAASYPPGSGGTTALIAAAGQGHVLGVSTVAEDRHLEAVRIAIELGGNVNEVDNRGLTALHAAAYVGFEKVIQYLATNGADLSMQDRQGRTPLDVATRDIYLGAPFSQDAAAALLRKLGGTKGNCVPVKDEPVSSCSGESMRGAKTSEAR